MTEKKAGRFAGVPYDWRRPTIARVKKAGWNPEAPLFTPKSYGWGYAINWYRVVHPFKRG